MPSYLSNTSLYNYPLFCQIWPTTDSFINDYKACDIPTTITDASAKTLYGLLCGEYYNSPIGFTSIGQWKLQIMTIIFCYGPTWERRLDLQNKLRNLTDDELVTGTIMMYNSAVNPSTPVQGTNNKTGTLSNKELNYINNQNTTLSTKNKTDAYAEAFMSLRTDVTTDFLAKFKPYFCRCVAPQRTPYYVYEKESNDDN